MWPLLLEAYLCNFLFFCVFLIVLFICIAVGDSVIKSRVFGCHLPM